MAEYIEREEVIKAAMNNKAVCQCLADIVDVKDIVNCVPTADVLEVVRCKDCEYHNDCSIEFTGMFGLNSFCCLGKRKDSEQE